MWVFSRTIASLVDENYIYARALDYLGIDFYTCPDKKLDEVCKELNINKGLVLKAFDLFDRSYRFSFTELQKYPLSLVVEYLKHTHHVFVKERLPYITRLINTYESDLELKLIWPEFVDEFIHHIYEEEDTLFRQVASLLQGCLQVGGDSLKAQYRQHKDDDELAGIRQLVDGMPCEDMHLAVVIKELKAFDREMMYHAEIENKILFPKAIALEATIINQ